MFTITTNRKHTSKISPQEINILTDKKGQIRQALLGRSRRYCAVYTTVYFSSKIVSITALLLVQVLSSRDGVAWRRDQSGV